MRKLSNLEKLQVMCSLNASLPEATKLDAELVFALLWDGDEWALHFLYDCFEREPHPKDAIVTEVIEIFEVFEHLQHSEKEATGEVSRTIFQGFDANQDGHFGVANVFVRKLNRFSFVVGAGSNSHNRASLDRTRKIVERYRALGADRVERNLSLSEIESCLSGS